MPVAAGGGAVSTLGFSWAVLDTSEAPVFRTIAPGEGVVSTMGPSWVALGGSEAFLTIARGEIDGAPGSVMGELARNKMTAALAVAPTAHATNVTKRV